MRNDPTFSNTTLRLIDTTTSFFFGHRSIKIIHLNCLIDAAKVTSFFDINSSHIQYYFYKYNFIIKI